MEQETLLEEILPKPSEQLVENRFSGDEAAFCKPGCSGTCVSALNVRYANIS